MEGQVSRDLTGNVCVEYAGETGFNIQAIENGALGRRFCVASEVLTVRHPPCASLQHCCLPSPATGKPYSPSLTAAGLRALPLPRFFFLLGAMECHAGTAGDHQAADDDVFASGRAERRDGP